MIMVLISAVMIVPVVVIVPVVTEITVVMTIPMVVVLDPPVASIPIPAKILFSIMVGRNPTRLFVRRSSPISWVPPIVMSDRIPIAVHPNELRRWSSGHHRDHARRRRSPDPDSDRDLPMSCLGAQSA